MTEALFDMGHGTELFERIPVQSCGCPVGEGHVCRPPWMDVATWPGYSQSCNSPDRMSAYKSGPRSGVRAPNESEGLTANKERLMHSILPARDPHSGGGR